MQLEPNKLEFEMKNISGSTFKKVNAQELDFDNVNLSKTKVNNANLSEMALNNVNASGWRLTDINLSQSCIQNANMSDMKIEHIHLMGTEFSNIILPVEGDGNYNPEGDYRPILFKNCNLTNMEIIDCDITGLKINGILIEELLKKL
ncbi:pentapeptide repeat-containing protein [Paenibacillus roseipurpureus]|uniref:Pentapeptide repeat-containing protein n=1 Tax=Paenibacillus roseopurpureus TaxID=2918901 RepID=A0AA96LS30_9BACL|nr:pentapeptide repeat-containing protein [Paenibacillus sp. MBLB1832]WNR46201.1 pentapeptide repeat-containing protein [Paenibacillus sp. MBLB1832]